VQEESVNDAIRIIGNNPTLVFLIHAVTGKAARHKLRLPAWILSNIIKAHCAALCSALYNSAGMNV
jgi:hypothetical protein